MVAECLGEKVIKLARKGGQVEPHHLRRQSFKLPSRPLINARRALVVSALTMMKRHSRLNDRVQELAFDALRGEPDFFERFVALKELACIEKLNAAQILRRKRIGHWLLVNCPWSVVRCFCH